MSFWPRFWRLTARSLVRTKVQLLPRRCALLYSSSRPVAPFFHKALCHPRSVGAHGATTRSRTTNLWQLMRGLAAGLKKGSRPSRKLLFSGAIAFLWERERIPTDDAISCLKEYDNRVKSQLHMMLEESPVVVTTTAPSTPGPETIPSPDHTSLFKHKLNTLLQQHSEKHLSQLPLVGLQKMGLLSSASAKAGEVVHRVTVEAVGRLSEAKAYLSKPVRPRDSVAEFEELEEFSHECESIDTAPVSSDVCHIDEIVSEGNVKAVTEAMLECYVEHSKRHMAQLPLVGLQHPGSVYNLSRSVADSGRRLFAKDTNVHRASLFLAHFGISLSDMPSFSPSGLQIDSASLVVEGFSNMSLKTSLDSALKQAKELLSLCASPRTVLDTFDSMSNRQDELENSSGRGASDMGMACTSASQESVVVHQTNQVSSSHQFSDCTSEERNQHTGNDSYLQQSGWEHFVEAQSCTVYRKPHHSGLFMYKVIGRFTDISVKDFLDVQVDHTCRKEWDSYVQKLETVEVDPETGTEVVHWVMKFPFPMSSREYLYVRRMWINKNVAVLINRSVSHPAVSVSRNRVRVQDYVSHTVMHPHTTSYEEGFEYEVTYFDNPQTTLPSSCVNWVATAAMPEFLTKVHTAACLRKRQYSELLTIQTI